MLAVVFRLDDDRPRRSGGDAHDVVAFGEPRPRVEAHAAAYAPHAVDEGRVVPSRATAGFSDSKTETPQTFRARCEIGRGFARVCGHHGLVGRACGCAGQVRV